MLVTFILAPDTLTGLKARERGNYLYLSLVDFKKKQNSPAVLISRIMMPTLRPYEARRHNPRVVKSRDARVGNHAWGR
jgi:hypothetical protein